VDYLELAVQDDHVSFFDDFPLPLPNQSLLRGKPQPWDDLQRGGSAVGAVARRSLRSESALAVLREFEAFQLVFSSHCSRIHGNLQANRNDTSDVMHILRSR